MGLSGGQYTPALTLYKIGFTLYKRGALHFTMGGKDWLIPILMEAIHYTSLLSPQCNVQCFCDSQPILTVLTLILVTLSVWCDIASNAISENAFCTGQRSAEIWWHKCYICFHCQVLTTGDVYADDAPALMMWRHFKVGHCAESIEPSNQSVPLCNAPTNFLPQYD